MRISYLSPCLFGISWAFANQKTIPERRMSDICYPEYHQCDSAIHTEFFELWDDHQVYWNLQLRRLLDVSTEIVFNVFNKSYYSRPLYTPAEHGLCPHAVVLAFFTYWYYALDFDTHSGIYNMGVMEHFMASFYQECGRRPISDYFYQNLGVSLSQMVYHVDTHTSRFKYASTAGLQLTVAPLQQAPIELTPIGEGISSYDILDIGANFGIDSLHYVQNGFRTVALEGMRQAFGNVSAMLSPALEQGYYKIFNRVLTPKRSFNGTASFCHVGYNPELSYLMCDDKDASACDQRPELKECRDGTIEHLDASTCYEFLLEIGLPSLYLKIDIEDQSTDCIHALKLVRANYPTVALPPYVSLEVDHYFEAMSMIDQLLQVGYTRFKVADQKWYAINYHFKFKIFN